MIDDFGLSATPCLNLQIQKTPNEDIVLSMSIAIRPFKRSNFL